jgi:UDP-glucose 4-epimerase
MVIAEYFRPPVHELRGRGFFFMINSMQKKGSVLVTGAAGFIGSHVADELIAMGKSVVVLDDLSGGFRENVHGKAKFIKGSVTDAKLVDRIFKENNIEYVFHLAAYAAEGLSHFIRKFNYENNLIGSINLINASVKHDVKCFVFTSSIAVYGKNQLPMRESTVPMPEDPYGISKFAVEQDLRAAHEMFGLNYIIFRPHNVYGERQNLADKYRNVIGIFINQAKAGKPMMIFGDGKQKRAFSHIGDVAPIIAKAAFMPKAYNHIFNIGADKPYTVKELAKKVSKHMGVSENIQHVAARNEVKLAYADHSKIKQFFNHESKYSLDDGLKAMLAWAKTQNPKPGKKFKNIEVMKNMPPSWLS